MSTDPMFRLTIADAFTITGRGTIVTGTIESGALKIGDEVFVNRSPQGASGSASGGASTKTHVTGLQVGPKAVHEARQGDLCGVVLRGIKLDAVSVGDVLSANRAS